LYSLLNHLSSEFELSASSGPVLSLKKPLPPAAVQTGVRTESARERAGRRTRARQRRRETAGGLPQL